jgi:hypothetical protein
VLENVRSPEWTDWMEIYLLMQCSWSITVRPNEVVRIEAGVEQTEQTEQIVRAIKKVYKSERGLERAWRRREGEEEGEGMSGVLRYAMKLKDISDTRWKYEVLSVLLGTKTSMHVYGVLGKGFLSDGDWEGQIFKGMYSQMSDY